MIEDRLLIEQARRGSADAISTLFDRYWLLAWQTSFRLLSDRSAADDVAQDAMLKAFAHLGTFRGDSAFKTWLTRIVINTAKDALRDQARRSPDDAFRSKTFDTANFDEVDSIRGAVSRLPDDQRIALVLRYWLDLKPAEISAILQVPTGTVHSRLARAIVGVRQTMEVKDVG